MKKKRIMRVVTVPDCINYHLSYTLGRLQNDFEVCVVGSDVSQFCKLYPNILWVDLDLERGPNLFKDASAVIKLYQLIRVWKPDVVHSLMPKAGLVSAISAFVARVPVRMHTFTGQIWATKSGLSRYVLLFFDWLINALNTICLTDSTSQSSLLAQHGISYKGRELPVISQGSLSGVDLSRFNPDSLHLKAEALRNALGIQKSDFIYAYIARKTRDKGAFDMLLAFVEVLKVHAEIKLLFVGPDESLGDIDRLFHQYPMLEESVIRVDKAVMNPEVYLMLADVLCLPSYREGFGSIVIDAASLSVPTIGTNIMGLVDAIQDEKTGLLVEAGNTVDFSDAMLVLIENPEILKQMGYAARERVLTYFDADIIYRGQVLFYDQLIGLESIK